MEVMFTTHPKDGPGKFYMAIASKEEWEDIREALIGLFPGSIATDSLIRQLESWGIGD